MSKVLVITDKELEVLNKILLFAEDNSGLLDLDDKEWELETSLCEKLLGEEE